MDVINGFCYCSRLTQKLRIIYKMGNDQKKSEFTNVERVLIGLAFAFGIIGFIVFITSIFYFKNGEIIDKTQKINSSKFGDFGSFISGAVGALWSLVGVILFYITLRLQRRELSLQRDELELTRGELQGQKDQMIQQNYTLRNQQFENTFFQLLSLYGSIVNSLDLRNSSKTVIHSGRDCFESFYKKMGEFLLNIVRANGKLSIDQASIEEVINAYEKLYNTERSNMSHYFRTVYHIFKFIDRADIQDKKQYISITRAQLSSYEQVLIFYNCLHRNGVEKFKPLIEKYAILKNIDSNLLINKNHLDSYNKGAYKNLES